MKTQSILDTAGLPCSPDIERWILGCVVEHGAWSEAVDLASVEDFTSEANRRIWRACETLANDGHIVDPVVLAEALRAQGELESIGGLSYIVGLSEGLPRLSNLASYAKILREKSQLRRLIASGQALMEMASQADGVPVDIAAWATKALESVTEDPQESGMESAEEIMARDFEAFCDPSPKLRTGVWLPWRSVADLIPALMPGELVLLAARPAVGKSSAAFQIAYEAAKRGLPVAAFSLEMPPQSILARLACSYAGVDSYLWRRGMMNPDEKRRFRETAADIAAAPLFIYGKTDCSPSAMLATLRKMKPKPRLVVVDYLQLMHLPGRQENRNQEVSQISRAMKRGALELNVPVLALSQLSRDSDKTKRPPELSDLRDSGSLEQDADTVMFLYPEADDTFADEIETSLYVKKQRNGPVGKVRLRFKRRLTRFEE